MTVRTSMAVEDGTEAWLSKVPQATAVFWIVKILATAVGETGGDTVQFGEEKMDVYHCPGHTPGHVVFVSARHRIAFVGDVLFAGSIGRTDFPRGNHADLIRSIRTKLWPLGDDITFVPGHGPTSTFGEERRTNPYVADGVSA